MPPVGESDEHVTTTLHAAARELHRVAGDLGDVHRWLGAAAADADWSSRAAQRFHTMIEELAAEVARISAEAAEEAARVRATTAWELAHTIWYV